MQAYISIRFICNMNNIMLMLTFVVRKDKIISAMTIQSCEILSQSIVNYHVQFWCDKSLIPLAILLKLDTA